MLKLFEIGRSHMAVLVQLTPEALARRASVARDAAEAMAAHMNSSSDEASDHGTEPESLEEDEERPPERKPDWTVDFDPSGGWGAPTRLAGSLRWVSCAGAICRALGGECSCSNWLPVQC